MLGRYIKIVEEKALLRKLIKASNELVELGYAQNEDIDMVMDQAEKKIFDIMQGKNQKGFSAIKDVLIESFAEIEKLYNQKEPITGVPTGFADLDYKTAGLASIHKAVNYNTSIEDTNICYVFDGKVNMSDLKTFKFDFFIVLDYHHLFLALLPFYLTQ